MAQFDDGRDPFLGECAGRYRLVRRLGQGGMGAVYEAVHEELGVRAAVKVLHLRHAPSPQDLTRFHNEARAISRVSHQNLVKVQDSGQLKDGTPYLLLEYLEGETLRQRLLQRGRLLVPEALRLCRQVAAALQATHEAHITHRDLKPENVMLVADPEVPSGERAKLLDFGVAKLDQTHLTTAGTVLGTVTYMAPEQCSAEDDVGAAVDVYALGVVLYELLCGKPPFSGSASQVMRMHIGRPPVPLRELPDLPPMPLAAELSGLCNLMMDKEPDRRPTIAQVTAELSRLELLLGGAPSGKQRPTGAAQSGLLAPRSPEREERRMLLLGVGLLVLGLCAVGVGLWRFGGRGGGGGGAPPQFSGMVRLAGGEFEMGSSADEIEAAYGLCQRFAALRPAAKERGCVREVFEREQTRRRVRLSPYYLDRTEVDNARFATWLSGLIEVRVERTTDPDDEPALRRYVYWRDVLLLDLHPQFSGITYDESAGRKFAARPGRERRPVVQVTWDGAQLYCQARGMTLPTEAQWEFAARGPGRRAYPFGAALPGDPGGPPCAQVALGRMEGLPCGGLPAQPADVGRSDADHTPEGILDLGGNVMEWTLDPFQLSTPPCEQGVCRDPVAPAPVGLPGGMSFSIRGGSVYREPHLARGAARGQRARAVVMTNLGFRCAVTGR